ncbi:MAG: DUF455 family protein, partial [Verrucomicrobiae bacterium]|nr:DUF455 family protein [Verrucomicrobiae bacterium]
RLSLTFEQANLDYTKHFAAALREVGDVPSGKLMDRIYRDEIGHVGYGLRWFREWKQSSQSDWDAYRRRLVFPLSPSRAKGNGTLFNANGRLEAGLGEEFVRELSLFERSKGRTPNVFWFNPDAEDAMAKGVAVSDYQAGKKVARFIADLEPLVLFLSRRDDVVLMRSEPRREYLERLRSLGFDLPEIEIVASELELASDSLTRERKLYELRPWSWEPRAAALFGPLLNQVPDSSPAVVWSETVRSRFSKGEQMDRWPDWEPRGPWRSFACRSAEERNAAIRQIHDTFGPEHPVFLKQSFAAAGRGNSILDPTGVGARSYPVGSEPVVIEPWVDRVFDFSVQYEMTGEGLRFVGFCRQILDSHGRYRGTVWTPKFCSGLPSELARFLMETVLPRYDVEGGFAKELESWLGEADYRGPVGVDAFVFRGISGALRHRLLCEVNPRYTMGRLTWELSRKVAPGRAVRFEIVKRAEDSGKDRDIVLDGRGRVSHGSLMLNDPGTAKDWVARLTVGE